jgi:hypothetical protein
MALAAFPKIALTSPGWSRHQHDRFLGRRAIGQFVFLLVVAAAVATLFFAFARPGRQRVMVPRMVLVFHYGWWATGPSERHWGVVDPIRRSIDNTANFPVTGPYHSQDPIVIERQLAAMGAAGVTGLVASWWGQELFEDATLDLLVPAAERHGLAITAYYETLPAAVVAAGYGEQVDAAVADITRLLDRHGDGPSWLRIAGRPVLFVYARAVDQLGVEGWRRVAARMRMRDRPPILVADLSGETGFGEARLAFEGVHIYNDSAATAGLSPAGLRLWARRTYARRMRHWSGLLRCVTIHPGFDARKANGWSGPDGVTLRHDGQTLVALGEAALAAKPEWLLVTSWNEWHEGTEIEPSLEHGDRALNDLAAIARQFTSLPPSRLALRE